MDVRHWWYSLHYTNSKVFNLMLISLSLVCRDDSAVYLAGLGTLGMEIHEQVSKLDAVIVPAGGQCGLLAGTAVAIKHLNSRIMVIVSVPQLYFIFPNYYHLILLNTSKKHY